MSQFPQGVGTNSLRRDPVAVSYVIGQPPPIREGAVRRLHVLHSRTFRLSRRNDKKIVLLLDLDAVAPDITRTLVLSFPPRTLGGFREGTMPRELDSLLADEIFHLITTSRRYMMSRCDVSVRPDLDTEKRSTREFRSTG